MIKEKRYGHSSPRFALERTDEEKKLELVEIELMFKKYCYIAIKYFLALDQYYYVEQVMEILKNYD